MPSSPVAPDADPPVIHVQIYGDQAVWAIADRNFDTEGRVKIGVVDLPETTPRWGHDADSLREVVKADVERFVPEATGSSWHLTRPLPMAGRTGALGLVPTKASDLEVGALIAVPTAKGLHIERVGKVTKSDFHSLGRFATETELLDSIYENWPGNHGYALVIDTTSASASTRVPLRGLRNFELSVSQQDLITQGSAAYGGLVAAASRLYPYRELDLKQTTLEVWSAAFAACESLGYHAWGPEHLASGDTVLLPEGEMAVTHPGAAWVNVVDSYGRDLSHDYPSIIAVRRAGADQDAWQTQPEVSTSLAVTYQKMADVSRVRGL